MVQCFNTLYNIFINIVSCFDNFYKMSINMVPCFKIFYKISLNMAQCFIAYHLTHDDHVAMLGWIECTYMQQCKYM